MMIRKPTNRLRNLILSASITVGLILFISCLNSPATNTIGALYSPVSPVGFATSSLFQDVASTDAIRNSTLGFEKIFIISMPTRHDQRDSLALAAATTDLAVEFVDGVLLDDIDLKGFPDGATDNGEAACWRAHLNVAQRIVRDGISSALIMEDDTDWDVRIKSQLQDFARASRFLLQEAPIEHNTTLDEIPVLGAVSSPYGDNWDLLWLGACGVRQPAIESSLQQQPRHILDEEVSGRSKLQASYEDPQQTPSFLSDRLRRFSKRIRKEAVIHYGDDTVPDMHDIRTFNDDWFKEDLKSLPPQTRVYHYAADSVCAWTYALSQRGARRLLYEAGVQMRFRPLDVELRMFCQMENSADQHLCLGVQPPLFSQHYAKGSMNRDSNMREGSDSIREKAVTHNIIRSARLNIPYSLKDEPTFYDQ